MGRAKRRPYGSGTVFQRASDKRWIGKFEAGRREDGTRLRGQVSARTKGEAWDKLDARLEQLQNVSDK